MDEELIYKYDLPKKTYRNFTWDDGKIKKNIRSQIIPNVKFSLKLK